MKKKCKRSAGIAVFAALIPALLAVSACQPEPPIGAILGLAGETNNPEPDDSDPVPVITITTQPAPNTVVTEGAISDEYIFLTATVTEGAPLSYQWYRNTSASNTGGTAIPGLSLEYFAIPADLTAGTYYYFCEITAPGAASKRSDVAVIVTVSPDIKQAEGATLADKFDWIAANVTDSTNYLVELTGNDTIAPTALNYPGKSGVLITLTGAGGERTISLSGPGTMFTVGRGNALILENNITLAGRTDNTTHLVEVYGTLVLNNGAKITGNTASGWGESGGVNVAFGTFTMNGGEISGNNTVYHGGGVNVYGGSFIMNGGKISGNTVPNGGGGVEVYGGTFIMNDGEISGNTGGGVYVIYGVGYESTFTMNGGKISGNTAAIGGGVSVAGGTFGMTGGEVSGNTASFSNGGGGGVLGSGHAYAATIFTMSGGVIGGNTASSSNGGGVFINDEDSAFHKTGGVIYGNDAGAPLANSALGQGHAVYWDTVPLYRDSTLGAGDNISTADTGVNWELATPDNNAPLLADGWNPGSIAAGGEQWFKFTASAADQYIHVKFGTLTYLNMYSHAVEKIITGSIGKSGSTGDTIYLRVTGLTAGQTYYARITPYGSTMGTYEIAVTDSTTPPSP